MKRTALSAARLVLLGALALTGCSGSTKLTRVWTEAGFQTNSLTRLMVIGVAKNGTIRRVFEDTFAAALRKQGVEAIASYTLVGDGQIDSVQVNASIESTGCDGVFVTRIVDRKTVQTFYPPTATYVSAPGAYHGGWYGYYSIGYAYQSSPGYTIQNEVIHLETNLYRVSDAKLVWSGLSESWLGQGTSPGTEIEPFVQQLVHGLGTSKVVSKSKKK